MKKFDEIIQYHIDNNLTRVNAKSASSLSAKQRIEIQKCLDLHHQLLTIKLKPAFGHQALKATLAELEPETAPKQRFRWSTLKLGATAMASLLVVIVIGGFSWLGTNQSGSELSQDNVKPNGTIENLQNLNLADAENDTKAVQSDSNTVTSAEVNLAKTSSIDEAVNENF